MWRDLAKFWLSFSRREQIAILLLAFLLITILIAGALAPLFVGPPPADLSKASMIAYELQKASEPTANHPNDHENQTIREEKAGAEKTKLNPFEFDPNTADEKKLLALGLKPGQVRNILNYRTKGGKFRSAEDFGRIYSIPEEVYAQLAPYIRIALQPLPQDEPAGTSPKSIPEQAKPKAIELNSADSAALLQLPGSGPWTAHRILKYRQLLGGYAFPEQLLEVRGIDSLKFQAMKPWLSCNREAIVPLRINYLDFKTLLSHPYLNFEQVKALVNHRDRKGFIRNASELLILQGFTQEDIARLQPYLRFD